VKKLMAVFLIVAVIVIVGLEIRDREKQREMLRHIRPPEPMYRTSRGQYRDWAYVVKNCIIDSSGTYHLYIDTSGHGELARAMNNMDRLEMEIQQTSDRKAIGRVKKMWEESSWN